MVINNLTEKDRFEYFETLMNECTFPVHDVAVKLQEMGFFKAPASIHHHGGYEGALFDHSLTVVQSLLLFTKQLGLQWERSESPYIVGMFHDLCKVDNYHRTNDEAWEYNNATLLPGHGEKSVILTQQLIRLTDEEMYCIRWHMGAFDNKENWNSYGRAVTTYPNVLYTHTADMRAARILGGVIMGYVICFILGGLIGAFAMILCTAGKDGKDD